MKKLLTILILLFAVVAQSLADEYSTTIYPNHNVGSWNALQIDYSSITGIAANDKITVYIAKDSRTPDVQLQYNNQGEWKGVGLSPTVAANGESYEFTMTEESAGYYTNNNSKLIVTGQNYTITKVTWTHGETTKTLFGDPLELYNWGGTSVAKSWFEDATVGDILKATLNIPTPKVVFQYIDTDNNNSWTDLKNGVNSTEIELTSQSEVSLTLTSEMLANINKNSLIIKGVNYTIGKVTLKTSENDENPTTIYEGSTEENATEKAVVVGDWKNYVQISKDKFSSASANCIVTIAVSNYSPQVQFCDNSWGSLGDATVSEDKTTATLAITSDILSKIQTNDMIVKGINYKLETVELVTTRTETTINDTQTTISSSSTLTIAGSEGKFDTASANDILKIYLSSVSESDAAIELKAPGGSWPNILTSTSLSSGQKVYRLTLTEEIIKLLQEYGLYICGDKFTCDKVTLISAATGSVIVDDYFDTNGKADLSKLSAQSNKVSLNYDSTAKTAKITSTSGWTGVALSPFRTETVSGKELAITLSKGIQIKVAVDFSDGTSRMSIMDPDATSTETTYYFPLDGDKNISSIQIQPTAAQTAELTISNIQVNAAQTHAVFSDSKADLKKFVAISSDEYSYKSSTSDAYYRYTQKQTEATGIVLDIPSEENIYGTNKQVKITFTEAKKANVLYTINNNQTTKEMSEASTTVAFPLDASNALTQIIIKGTATISGDGETIGISEVAVENIAAYEGTELVTAEGSEVASTAFPFQFKAESSLNAGDGTNWKKANFTASQFSSVKAGDKIYIYVAQAEDCNIALQEYGGGDALPNGNNLAATDGKAVYELTASAAAFLKDNGASLTGQNYTVNKVTLVAGDGSASIVTMDVANFYDITGGKRLYFGSGSTQAISGNKELIVTFSEATTAETTIEVTYVNAETDVSSKSAESDVTTIAVPLTSNATIKKIEVKSTGTITMSNIAISDAENPNERELYNPETKPEVTTDNGVTVAEYWKFGNAAVGDKIIVYGSDIAGSTTIALKGAGSNGKDSNNTAFYWTELTSGSFTDSKYEYTLNADDLTNLQANGLLIIANAGSFKIEKVTLISENAIPTSEPVALNEGDEEPDASIVDVTVMFSTQTALGNYDVGSVQVVATDFVNVKTNDYIKVYLSSMTDNSELAFQNLGTWQNLTGFTTVKPSKNATKYVYKITSSSLTELQAGGLVIKGKDCTVDKIELLTAKSETPTAISLIDRFSADEKDAAVTYTEHVMTTTEDNKYIQAWISGDNISGKRLVVSVAGGNPPIMDILVQYNGDETPIVYKGSASAASRTLKLDGSKTIQKVQIYLPTKGTVTLSEAYIDNVDDSNAETVLFTLTTSAVNGSVAVKKTGETANTEKRKFEYGTSLTLTATANEGYTFSKWLKNGEAAGTEATLTVTMNADVTIEAVFKGPKLNNEERRTLWENSTGQALDWSLMFAQSEEVGEIVEAGEILIFSVSAIGVNPKIWLMSNDGNTTIAEHNALTVGENRMSITSDMVTKMAGGFKFKGGDATITKVALYKPTPITKLAEKDSKTLWQNDSGETLSWNTIAIDRAAEWGSVLEEDERFIISVKAKESGDNIWPTIQLQDLDGGKVASTATLLNDVKVPSDIVITLTAEMVEKLKNGFSITGDKATITKAVLYKPALPAKTVKILNDTETAITGDALVTVSAAKLANISAYDVLTVNFAINAEKAKLVIKCNGEKDGWDYIKEMEFSGNETLFALPLTESAVALLKANGLGITGSGYTFKSVTIKTAGEVLSGGEEPEISNTDASEEAKKLFNVLKDLYGKKIVSGVVANVDWNTKEAENVYNWTGKWPALNVYDFINLHASKDVNSAGWVDYSDITTAKNWWKEGGIVGAMWHWQVKANNGTDYTCTPGTAADETSFDASKVYVDGTSENTLAKQQLDQLCGYLKKMQDAGIPVVWRPLHEGSGNVEQYAGGKAWFWWGAKGADVYKQLWQWMYNYMVKTKGLNNLIWVWTSQTKDNNWYPGDAYVDIIGRDNYGATAATLATEYEALKDTYSNKMMTLSECGNSETAEMAKLSSIWDAGSRWSWFMTWYDGAYNDGTSTTHKHADKTWWDDAMAKDYVVTRDQMKELLGQDSGGGSQTGVNISLDDLNEGWSSTYDATTKTITTTGEWAARGWYIGDDRYSQKGSITVKYEAVQFGVTLKMEYTNTNGDSKSVSAGAAAGETEVELDIPADVKTIEKVYITYQPIGTLKLTAVSVNDKVVDNRTEKTLVETSQAISDGDIKINRGLFSNAVAKDVLYIYATGLSDASKIALEPADYSGALDGAQWTAFTESPFTLKLTESALATIKEKGLLVRGENFTFTKATLYTESDLGSIIPDEEEPSIDPEVPSTNEPVINEGGEVKLDEVKAQDETTTVTYNKEEETLTITTTEPYKAAQIWLNEPEEVTNEVLKVEIAESNANVIVAVGYTDGTETSAASGAATAASRALRALSRGATEETGTVVTVPLSAGKEIQKIEIKNVEPGTITITSMSVTTLINEGETVTLWSSNEGETLAWNDIARQTTDLTNLLKEYDELLITVSARAEGNDWPKVFLRDINYESVGRETLLNEVTTFPYIVRYVLTSELLEKIKDGFSVCGDGVTITKVELYRPVPPKEGDIHLRSLDYGYGSSYDASITTMTTTTRWAARGWEIGDMRYNSKDLVIIGYEAVDFPVTIKMEYVDDKGQKQATSTGVAAGQNYVQMAIPEGITQLDRVYLTYQNPGSLKLTEASVVTTGEARSRGFINDGVTTGIKDVKRSADMNDKWYDMNGRQVKQPSKGLYIKNGKKIMHH